MNSLSHVHRKDIESIRSDLKDFKCSSCSATKVQDNQKHETVSTTLTLKPIGVIRTVFSEKKAVPRQANIADTILSRIELDKDLYTAPPEECLKGLEEFTHFWILFHFHKNDSHKKPMIAPPRLDGKKVGVLATRSPHRPNPIGISLVRLSKIEGSSIYFHGSDMVDQTPVIDIKPYIPSYDSPQKLQDGNVSSPTNASRSRGEPEGEEEIEATSSTKPKTEAEDDVKVPTWVSDKNLLKVMFSENALQQIADLGVSQASIQEILENDPRSVYVREKYLSQIYNFQLSGNNVMCKFDDKQGTVNVLQIRRLINLSE